MFIYDLIFNDQHSQITIFLSSKCESICLQNHMMIWPKLKIFYHANHLNLEIAGKFARNTV